MNPIVPFGCPNVTFRNNISADTSFFLTPNVTYCPAFDVYDFNELSNFRTYFSTRSMKGVSINAMSQNDPAVFTLNDVRQFILFLKRPAAHGKTKNGRLLFIFVEILK